MDLNADGEISDEDYSKEYALGACEDHVYCPLVASCTSCGQNLNFKKCFELVCEYYKDVTGDAERAVLETIANYEFGACLTEEEKQTELTWQTGLFDENGPLAACLAG
ncbi:MAG: hypothetical protein HC945_00375 [Nitrosarchaeum sp.]|nr:hypothetical protein [Nitrosarchaeum sp.]